MEIAVLIWIACGVVAAIIGSRKGEGCAAFFIGIILGPIGILLALGSSGNRRPCPFCKEMIHKEAVVCPHCQRDLVQPEAEARNLEPVKPSPAVYDAARAVGEIVGSLTPLEAAVIVGVVAVGVLLLYLYVR